MRLETSDLAEGVPCSPVWSLAARFLLAVSGLRYPVSGFCQSPVSGFRFSVFPQFRVSPWFPVFFLLSITGAMAADDNLAARVIVVANSDDPDSLRIARHYAEVRRVPAANVISLKMSLSDGITWREFVATIWRPLLEHLVAAEWIDATPMALADAVGRRKYVPRAHRIAALVVCRGVPLKIAHEPDFLAPVPPLTNRSEFRTNAGAVDAELSLLAQPNYSISAFVANPLFHNDHPTRLDRALVVKVSRLDGPTAADANALVDRALLAERQGVMGRAYVDLANRERVGDAWLDAAASQLMALGFDTNVDRESPTMPMTARIDAPIFYFGWYASDINGPFTLPGFAFAPGAIALHIHSFSAATLRQPAIGWTGPMVARGVTATVGNVHEPYLALTHRPDLMVRALARGDTLVDAAYYSLQALSWQTILIGDPLYRPFAVSLEEQLRNIDKLPAPLAQYAVLRKWRQLDSNRQREEADLWLDKSRPGQRGLALALVVAEQLRAAGKVNAADSFRAFSGNGRFAANEWALVRDAANFLHASDRPAAARDFWRALLATREMPDEMKIAWLPEAISVAAAANDNALVSSWRELQAKLRREKK